jgi:nicotinate-nucleotide pyrophosphorylase (carboxylating)
MKQLPLPADLDLTVERALAEDVGTGDLTAALVPANARCRAQIVTREAAVLCGAPWASAVFRRLDPAIALTWRAADGDELEAGQVLLDATGPARPLLTGERTALNFLQTLSGTATLARRYARALAGTHCQLLDTRKTLPGLRLAQKYAVRCGGGQNHRLGLYDGILIKENHIAAAGSIAAAVARARATAPAVRVEVEVESLGELDEAFAAEADMALLDDFALADLRRAVAANQARHRPLLLEASGGVDLETVRTVAATGVDFVSVGALTKHLRVIDLSMRCTLVGDAPTAPGSCA